MHNTTTGATIAARVMAGEPLSNFAPFEVPVAHMAVKEAVFPFSRFPGADPVLSPEMKSTGEVMGIDREFPAAFLKSQLGAGMTLPDSGTLFVSVKDSDKPVIVPAVKALLDHGFEAVATGGTQLHHDLDDDGILVSSSYGSLDSSVATFTDPANVARLGPAVAFTVIDGGNHEQMGWYTGQPNDPPATISRDAQQSRIVAATVELLSALAEPPFE
mgnify:CR=1 FL=1